MKKVPYTSSKSHQHAAAINLEAISHRTPPVPQDKVKHHPGDRDRGTRAPHACVRQMGKVNASSVGATHRARPPC